MRIALLSAACSLLVSLSGFSQTAQPEHYITASGNMFLPFGESARGTYPILWYDKETDSKILIGGFGLGYAQTRQFSPNLILKGRADLSKQTFWEEAIDFKDANGLSITHYLAAGSNYSAGISATAHFPVSDQFSIGAGLGSQVLLVSVSRVPPISASANRVEKEIVTNKFYKRVLPTLPVELSLKTQKKLYCIRYEIGLLSPYKSDLGKQKKEGYGLLSFEIGFKLGNRQANQPETALP